jgi:hypothetical protein
MRMSKPVSAVALATTLALGLAACGSGSDDASSSDTSSSPSQSQSQSESATSLMPKSTGDPFADARTAAAHMPMTAATLAAGLGKATDQPGDATSEASELRVGLTALLQEHVYLAGYAVDTAYVAGADSEEFKLAADALDGNSQDLAAAVGSLAGEEKQDAFLKLWRQHIGFFVDYAVATKTGDDAAAAQAQKSLNGYRQDAGAFFESVSGGELPKEAVAKNLKGHINTLSKAIDDLAAGNASAFDSLKMAGDHVVGSAAVLSAGLAKGAGLEGDTADKATELRVGLTSLLQEHVYLAGAAVFTAYTDEGGVDGEAFKAAAGTLDTNSQELAAAVESLAGKEKGDAFLELWRQHIGFFVDYAVGAAGDDQAAKDKALTSLDGYRPDAGAFFEDVSGGELPKDAVAEGLIGHVETLAGAIDSMAMALVK